MTPCAGGYQVLFVKGVDCGNLDVWMIESSEPAPPVTANEPAVRKPGMARRLWRYGPPIVWASLIFIGSSDLLSSSHTSSFIIGPLRALFPGASEATLAAIHFALRKLGHFTEYALLAWLTARALRSSSVRLLRERWFWISLSFIAGYALFDEFRQSFVPSRTSSIYDSLIDICGGLTALIVIFRRRKKVR